LNELATGVRRLKDIADIWFESRCGEHENRIFLGIDWNAWVLAEAHAGSGYD
jgi:hypothetical protein